MTAHDKYSLLNRDNLTQPIKMQLSGKQKDCYQSFSVLLKFTLNFEHCQKKENPHNWCISKITDSEKRG